jgi:hypothetical protein
VSQTKLLNKPRADYSAGKREQGEMGVETSFKTFGQLAETSQPSLSEVGREKWMPTFRKIEEWRY